MRGLAYYEKFILPRIRKKQLAGLSAVKLRRLGSERAYQVFVGDGCISFRHRSATAGATSG